MTHRPSLEAKGEVQGKRLGNEVPSKKTNYFVCFFLLVSLLVSPLSLVSLSLCLLAPPRVQLAPGPTHAKTGKRVTLPRCNVTGFPVPVVTWRKLGGVLATERAVYGEGSLTVVAARKADTGLYQCRAKNNLGESSAVTTLVVWTQPKFILRPPSRADKKGGQNLLLNCKATPLASISWRRVGGDWIADRMRVKNGTLEISSLTRSDSGSYICEARLLFYTIRATITLQVGKCTHSVQECNWPS